MKLYNIYDKDKLKSKIEEENFDRITLSFYKYSKILNLPFFRDHLYLNLTKLDVLGRIYIAEEGINGQISVPEPKFDEFKKRLFDIDFLNGIRLNTAIEQDKFSFLKLKIKIKDKIVADGLDDKSFDVTNKGVHLNAESFNEITNKKETLIVDMRNHYETEVGHFKNALTPDVDTFRESLPIVEDILKKDKSKDIVLYCTGGIRCEKASAYFKHKGFENVYQLEGGIIEYTRQVKEKNLNNKFIGKNFVFDDRLGEKISAETIAHCHQCGAKCDDHTNCANDACHILFIQCSDCKESNIGCCSSTCSDFIQLPEEEQIKLRKDTVFNGTKMGKGRYRAHNKNEKL